jgi:hypothetical protein
MGTKSTDDGAQKAPKHTSYTSAATNMYTDSLTQFPLFFLLGGQS